MTYKQGDILDRQTVAHGDTHTVIDIDHPIRIRQLAVETDDPDTEYRIIINKGADRQDFTLQELVDLGHAVITDGANYWRFVYMQHDTLGNITVSSLKVQVRNETGGNIRQSYVLYYDTIKNKESE